MISSLPKPVNRPHSRFYSESRLIVWYPWKQLHGLLLELLKVFAHNCTIKMMKSACGTNTGSGNTHVSGLPTRGAGGSFRAEGIFLLCTLLSEVEKAFTWSKENFAYRSNHAPPVKELPVPYGKRGKRDIWEHMDLFTRAILNVNCCQDGVCGRQQPRANCDTEGEKTRKGRLCVGVRETYSTFPIYHSINTHLFLISWITWIWTDQEN